MIVNDFAAKNEDGDPQIILDPSETNQYSMRQWVGLQPETKLASQQTKIFNMVISVPADAGLRTIFDLDLCPVWAN